MEINCQTNSAPTKLFVRSTPVRMRRITYRIDPDIYNQIADVARQEELDMSATTRELIMLALRIYKHKRGTLNANLPQNKKTFYCQSCMVETRIREVCYKTLDFDQYLICEGCLFNRDKLKSFVSKILQGV